MDMMVTTIGVLDKQPKEEIEGFCQIDLSASYGDPMQTISVDVFVGQGSEYKRREKALIMISDGAGIFFSGTFDELREKITGGCHGKQSK